MQTKMRLRAVERPEVLNCPVCQEPSPIPIGQHIRRAHGEGELRRIVLAAKERGAPDAEIGAQYGVSFKYLEQLVTQVYGANISVLKRPKGVRTWAPLNFQGETTTIWSFKQRGGWATHDGRYRGNWSPYIPRNVILRHTHPGDVVLDYFVGGGTTAVEAKLLGRQCIARDINPGAIAITRENLRFSPPRGYLDQDHLPLYEPQVSAGDARDLSDIPDASIDLVCAHPPYAGIIKYGSNVDGDLSGLSLEAFLIDMSKVARESLRVLKPGGKCAILIGDARSSKHIVPIGFEIMRVLLDAGFDLRELVIKRQHNCKTTGFWYSRSIEHNFLLLAHEYLPIFEKAKPGCVCEQLPMWEFSPAPFQATTRVEAVEMEGLETTTVWVFPKARLERELRRNMVGRFGTPELSCLEIELQEGAGLKNVDSNARRSLVYVAPPPQTVSEDTITNYPPMVRRLADECATIIEPGGFLIIDTKDYRIGKRLHPLALTVWEALKDARHFTIKEIVMVVPEPEYEPPRQTQIPEDLTIVHRYLLVFRRS